MKRTVIICFALFYAGLAFSEGDLAKIDSLNKLVGQQTGRERIETLIQLSEAYRDISLDKSLQTGVEAGKYAANEGFDNMKGRVLLSMGESASLSGDYALSLDYYGKAVQAFSETNEFSELAKAYNNIGLVHKNLADYDKAIEFLKKASEIEKEHDLTGQLAGSMGNMATIYFSLGEYNKAMDGYHQARQVYKDLHDTLRYAKMTMNVGLVYWQWDKNELALEMLIESQKLFEQKKEYVDLGRVYNNIGMLYYQNVKDTVRALEYYERSLSIRELLGNQLGMAVVLSNMGNVYRDRKQMPEAFERYDKALRISEAIGYKEGIVLTNYYIAIAHQKNNQFVESNRSLDRCLKIATDYGMKSYYNIVNEAKLKNYAAVGDYPGFMREFQIFSAEKDTLFNELNELKTKEAEARYKINELVPEIDRLQQENHHQETMLLLHRSLLVFFVVGFLVLAFIWRVRSRKKVL